MDNNNKEMNRIEADLKVLTERVKKNEEILELNLKSYRNYAFIILAILSLIGFVSVKTTIESVVSKKTEDNLNQILTEQYIEDKIRNKSEKTIAKLINEVEVKAKKIAEETLSFDSWRWLGHEKVEKGDYNEAIRCFKKAIEKISLFPNWKDYYILLSLHKSLAELQIITFDYKEALTTIEKISSDTMTKQDKVIMYFLKCITENLLGLNNIETEDTLNGLLSEKVKIKWSFGVMEEWLKSPDIKKEHKKYILDKIKFVKERTE
jgi:tetratricopeptide (TPR) repeat protein